MWIGHPVVFIRGIVSSGFATQTQTRDGWMRVMLCASELCSQVDRNKCRTEWWLPGQSADSEISLIRTFRILRNQLCGTARRAAEFVRVAGKLLRCLEKDSGPCLLSSRMIKLYNKHLHWHFYCFRRHINICITLIILTLWEEICTSSFLTIKKLLNFCHWIYSW